MVRRARWTWLPSTSKLAFHWRRVKGFWELYHRNQLGMVGLGILIFFAVMATVGVQLAPYGEWESQISPPFSPPSWKHLLGTDELGRDLFSLVIYGSRISLIVGVTAAISSAALGTVVGILAGYYGGLIDDILMRLTDAFLIIPSLVLMIVLASMLGPGIDKIIFVIAITTWPTTARVVRSQVLTLKERTFVESARAIGAGDLHIILKHILPNVTPLIFANMILMVSGAIISEAGLSFLGLGDPHSTSWGMLLRYASEHGAIAAGMWWYVVPPGLCILLLVVGFIFISYAVDEILNPRLRERM